MIVIVIMAVMSILIMSIYYAIGFPPKVGRKKYKLPVTTGPGPAAIVQSIYSSKIPEEDREWFHNVSAMAGFDIWNPKITVPHKRVTPEMEGGTPNRFSSESGLLEINGTWYQKWNNTTGSYLKEVAAPRAQEEVHEESTTVRDIAGSVVAEHRCTCSQCSRSLPDPVCNGGVSGGEYTGL